MAVQFEITSIKYLVVNSQISQLQKQTTIFTENCMIFIVQNNIHLPVDLPLDAASQYMTTCYEENKTNQLSKVVKEMRFEEVTANTKIEELRGRIRELEAVSSSHCFLLRLFPLLVCFLPFN